jgi:hypothetical protein
VFYRGTEVVQDFRSSTGLQGPGVVKEYRCTGVERLERATG